MKVLAVIAHPNPQSFNHALLESFKKGLAEGGHELDIIDLYANGFNPVLGMEDFAPYVGGPYPSDVQDEQKKVAEADALAFFYPVWWSLPPAILKGWLERVFTLGFAFKMDDSGLTGLLKHQKAVIVNTTMGPEPAFKQSGLEEAMRKIMVDENLKICGLKNVDYHFLYGVTESPKIRQNYLDMVFRMGKEF